MDIYIKGMEMPKDGCHHMICIYANGTVSTGGKEYTAIPVPPHGRLGDLDELKMKIKKEDNAYGFDSYRDGMYNAFQSVYQRINDAPTIIPASIEGET